MPNVKIWISVPDGSTFETAVSGTTDNFDVDVDIDSETGQAAEFGRLDLDPGPARFTVHSPHSYTARVDVEVVGDPPAAVAFTARIIKSNGTTFDQPYSFTTPAKEDTYLATIGIVTVKH